MRANGTDQQRDLTVRSHHASALPAGMLSGEQVRAQVLGALLAPGGALARMLNAPTASLVRVINAHAEQLQGNGEA